MFGTKLRIMAPWLLAVVVVWPTARPAGAVGVGQDAPEISAKNWINSEPLALKNLKDKVVVVSFWLSSNSDCRRSIPVLKRLHHAHSSRGLVVIGLSNESTSTVRAYVKQTGMNYAVGANSTSAAAYGVRSTPYAYVVKQGQVIWAGNPRSGLEDAVSQALPADEKEWDHPEVAAFINDDIKITTEEFQVQIDMRQKASSRPVNKSVKQSVLYGLATQKIVEQALETKRVKIAEQDIDTFYEQVRKEAEAGGQLPKGLTFEQALQQFGVTIKRVRNDIRIRIGLERIAAGDVNAAAVKEAFQRDAAKYQHVRARHILIRTKGLDKEQKAEARRKIAAILKRVKRGEDFATLAGNYSACSSKTRGGDLGLLRRGRRVPAFEKAAFALKPGETSEIVGTRQGFHIIQTTERSLTYEKLKDEIRRQLVGKKISRYMRALMKDVVINANPNL